MCEVHKALPTLLFLRSSHSDDWLPQLFGGVQLNVEKAPSFGKKIRCELPIKPNTSHTGEEQHTEGDPSESTKSLLHATTGHLPCPAVRGENREPISNFGIISFSQAGGNTQTERRDGRRQKKKKNLQSPFSCQFLDRPWCVSVCNKREGSCRNG